LRSDRDAGSVWFRLINVLRACVMRSAVPRFAALFVAGACLLLSGCGASHPAARSDGLPPRLVAESRPIGRGADFQPPASGPVIGGCGRRLGTRIGVHVELFAANRVVIVAAGIGTRPPYSYSAGRISAAGCYGELVTLEPTGVVQVRPRARLRLADLFRAWGQPLSSRRIGSFTAPASKLVAVFVDGRRWRRSPGTVPLAPHSEIVLELPPYVPPHTSYTFPPGT
jgi:hypothetical protein